MHLPGRIVCKFCDLFVFTTAALCCCGLLMTVGCNESPGPDPTAGLPKSTGQPPDPGTTANATFTPAPPVTDPPMAVAGEVELSDDELVIGVSAGGSSRAWLVRSLNDMQSHVVVDTRGPQPLAITWCDRTRCARVLTGQPGTDFQVQTAGFMNGEMWLRVNGRMLPQSSSEIPLQDQANRITSWGEWKAAHPDTTVFIGKGAEAAE